MPQVIKLPLGIINTNCYIVKTEINNAVIIDPGADAERLLRFLENNSLKPAKILLTHGHFDHIGAAAALKEKYGAEVIIHSADECMLSDSHKAMNYLLPSQPFYPLTADRLVSDGDEITQDELVFTVMHTPGHSAGSVCYFCEDCLFAGDTLFTGTIGRTDGFSASYAAMKQSLAKLKQIEKDFILYSGHGDDSTLRAERETNPFLL